MNAQEKRLNVGMKVNVYEVLAGDVGRIDRLLASRLDFSRARVRGLIDHGGVILNGQPCVDAGMPLAEGDSVQVSYDPQRRYKEKPVERKTHGFGLVFQDEHLVLVNKEAGLLTVPTDRRESRNLVDLLSHHLYARQNKTRKVAIVHRLDRDTSGLLIFGQRREIAEALIKQFAARKPEREYLAIVAGQLAQESGEIRSLLHSDASLNQKSGEHGELAITHYRVAARYRDATLVRVRLETGRRNQIRVHFSEMGHPVLGDERYALGSAQHRAWPYRRLALHARVLGFQHPVHLTSMRFEAAVPREFDAFARQCPSC